MKTKFKDTEIGMIPEDWEVKKIKDIGEVITGKTPPTEIKEYFGSDFPFIRIPDMGKSVYIDTSELMLSKKGAEYLKNLRLPKDSVMVSCLATVGKAGITAKYSFTNQQINSLICNKNKVIPLWVYYFFKNNISYLESLGGGGSVYTNISKSKFENSLIYTPKIEEQEKIVKILSNLDEKIELNQNMNKTLEVIAQVIFKRWFIDFEFPNENGEPYKSSGGEMVDSEMGLIPKGWRFEKLGNLLSEIVTGNRPKGGVSKFKKGIPSIGAESINGLCNYDFSKTKYIPESYFSNMKKGIVKNGDILLYKDGAKLGRKSMFLENFPFKRCCVNSHVFILRSNSLMKQSYLYFYLDQKFMTKNIINLNTNSAQPGINSTSVKTLRILLPSDKILNLFNELVFSILKKIFNDSKGNQCLSNLRDTLLPKLMSGEIRMPINSKVLISRNN